MLKYDTSIHTVEALDSQLQALQRTFTNVMITGSIGRSVLHGLYNGNPYFEFEYREEPVLGTPSKARDIDALGYTFGSGATFEPFPVDLSYFSNPSVNFVKEGHDWFLVGRRSGFSEPLHPDIMEPKEGQAIYDIPCRTLPAQTSLAIYGLRGAMRPKDRLTMELLNSTLPKLSTADTLPSELFKPFTKLEVQNRKRLMSKLAQGYYNLETPNIKNAMPPAVRKILRRFL